MKSSLLFLAILGCSLIACGKVKQSNIKDTLESITPDTSKNIESQDFSSYDLEPCPQYPGGEVELLNFVHKNLRYPQSAMKIKLEGRVTLRFTVDVDGKIINAKVIRELSPDCDKEALRIVNIMPRWIPAKMDGSAKPWIYTLPIEFRLRSK